MKIFKPTLLSVIMCLIMSLTSYAGVTIDFLDVGQGDSILIRSDQGTVILIDGGTEKAGRSFVVPYLQELGVSQLTTVIATHPHADHIGGLIPVINNFTVEKIYADGQVHTTRTYERFLRLIEEENIPFYLARSSMTLSLPGIDHFHFLHPQDTFLPGLNNNSVVIWMQVGKTSFLFTGDIETEAEELLLELGLVPQADVLKVAHHGSSSSTTQAFIDAVDPSLAVIMLGEGNSYGHPHFSSLIRLTGIDVYRTDLHGTITIRSERESLAVSSHKLAVPLEYRLNLRTSTSQQLQQVPGIGPVLAERIMDYRNTYGFTAVDQLIHVSGIGTVTVERIRDYFYLD